METVYIYSLIDPRDGEIKYVGKTKDLEFRLKTHFKNAKYLHTPKDAWFRKLARLGLEPRIKVLEEVDKAVWPEAERKWIASLRQDGCPLKNICDGGQGRSGEFSQETRGKLSEAAKRRKVSVETRRKLSWAARGRKVPGHCGKKKQQRPKMKIFSEETRAKMRAKKQGWRPPKELTEIQREKCKGEGNGRAKLTTEQVCEMRERYARGDISLPKLAGDYPVNVSTVHKIVNGKIWKHLLPQS